jgi:hypothetical protein
MCYMPQARAPSCGAQNDRPEASRLTIAGLGPLLRLGLVGGAGGSLSGLGDFRAVQAEGAADRGESLPAAAAAGAAAQAPATAVTQRGPALLDSSRWFGGWHGSLLLVKPETVLRWHRRGWRAYWSWRSRRQRGRGGRRPIPPELQALIRRITTENRLSGQKRMQAELSRLVFAVSARTVAKYMNRRSRGPSPGWRKFLKRHGRAYGLAISSVSKQYCFRRSVSSL